MARRIRSNELGMAPLSMVLIMVAVGGVVLGAFLPFLSTSMKEGQMIERKATETYSAGSGTEAGLWRIKYDGGSQLPEWIRTNTSGGTTWLESTYTHNPPYESYTLSPADPLNDKTVVYQISPKWTLGEGSGMLETPNATQGRKPNPYITVNGLYNGTGTVSGRGSYRIEIRDSRATGQTAQISRIGCWLPGHLSYVMGSSNLEKTGIPALTKVPVVTPYRGGNTVTWTYATPVTYDALLQLEMDMTKATVKFEYTPDVSPTDEFSWVRTASTGDDYLAWDMDLKLYEVKATATSPTGENTTATAYTSTQISTPFGAAMEGDYWAFGNTLMRNHDNDSDNKRERLYLETPSTVSAIPANASIKYVYLYWSGWKCKPWSGTTLRNYTADQWRSLCLTKNVDKVRLKIQYPVGTTVFNQVIEDPQIRGEYNYEGSNRATGASHAWSYSCVADITDRVKNAFAGTGFVGNGKYTVGHWDTSATSSSTYRYRLYTWKDDHNNESYTNPPNYTRYTLGSPLDGDTEEEDHCEDADTTSLCNSTPYSASQDSWSYAAWSIVVIYSSPSTTGHLLYITDAFSYVGEQQTVTKTISGFYTPRLSSEVYAARYTHFVGEGDPNWVDSVKIKGSGTQYALTDDSLPKGPCDNQCRMPSEITPNPNPLIYGVDIDTFNIPKTCIQPETDARAGDTTATVTFSTVTSGTSDSLNLIYIILSFRSQFMPGGVTIFRID